MNAPTRLAGQGTDPFTVAGCAYRSRLLIGTGMLVWTWRRPQKV